MSYLHVLNMKMLQVLVKLINILASASHMYISGGPSVCVVF